ncbi:hypothetical protein [Synechococcus sp. RS9902]|uniref:hypothetical protein n=1 Tax=Synechococcus sp. RS9902 TaxID=221345 RepID=UPI00210822BE|nr:hypothetical protein [Synechococcus sp. RS9902]
MKANTDSHIPAKLQFNIPSKKLPNTLTQKVRNSEWKKIIYAIEHQKVKPILELINKIDKSQNSPCLPHPFRESIDTFPTKSIREGMCNFIFFSDLNNSNEWILCQGTSFADAIFSSTYSGKHKLSINDKTIINSLKRALKKENKQNQTSQENNKAVFAGYLLDQTRPYHHFYDQLKWMVHLKNTKPVVSKNSFFRPKYLGKGMRLKRITEPTFSMFPSVIGSNQMGMRLDKYTNKLEKVVYQDSLRSRGIDTLNFQWNKFIKNIKKTSGKNKTLTLWFGISGQKRIWIEQEEFLPILIEQLKPWFDSFVFLIDGFTNYENSTYKTEKGSKLIPIKQDLEVINSIRKKLSPFPNTSVLSLVGETYRKKIQYCQSADFFIANAGAGQLVPHRFCKKPGILHSNEKHCVFPTGINNTTVKLVDKTLVKDVGNLFAKGKRAERSGTGLISYSIKSEVIINMVIEMLELRDEGDQTASNP